jgi:hypothetical protein
MTEALILFWAREYLRASELLEWLFAALMLAGCAATAIRAQRHLLARARRVAVAGFA